MTIECSVVVVVFTAPMLVGVGTYSVSVKCIFFVIYTTNEFNMGKAQFEFE